MTVALLLNVSAALGLYMLGSHDVSVLQAGLVRRSERVSAVVA